MSELFTIYSPEGEKFEVSRPNFRDLTTHRGWSQNPPSDAPAPKAEEAPAEDEAEEQTDGGNDGTGSEPQHDEPQGEGETEAGEADEVAEESDEGEAEDEVTETEFVAFTTVEQFADLEDKAAVQAYLTKHFPDFKFDGRANRDKLIEQAIELATAE